MPDDHKLQHFNEFRERMNGIILEEAPLEIKRFFSLDNQTYQDGALNTQTKELLGLVASMVLRCDDCITYHIQQCVGLGVTDEELYETMGVALIVGGSIVIPHMRRAVDMMKTIRGSQT